MRRKGAMSVKIHVVQSGDTLAKIAQKYDVDVDKIKEFNKQLANPDNIVVGMKIKIPTVLKPVKMERKEGQMPIQKEAKKQVQHPYKDLSPQAKPVVEEDEITPMEKQLKPYTKEAPKVEQPKAVAPAVDQQPSIPSMPHIEYDESSDHYYFNQFQVSMPTYYQKPTVPYYPMMGHHHFYHHKPKSPCGCGCGSPAHNVATYYMPVYPMQQQPYMTEMNQYQMFTQPTTMGAHEGYNQGQYPEMNHDEESSSLEMPEMPPEMNTATQAPPQPNYPAQNWQGANPMHNYWGAPQHGMMPNSYPGMQGYPMQMGGAQPYANFPYAGYGYGANQPNMQSPQSHTNPMDNWDWDED